MTWAFKRQFLYVASLVLFFAVIGFLMIYPRLNKAPSCMDGKQNGNETGVDCGGSCVNACIAQVDPVSVLWARAFRVIPGRYNAVAYLENHNSNTAINKIKYKFRFADGNNVYVGKREGYAYVPPSTKFAIFEPGIDIGNSIPVYTTFEFTQEPIWMTVPEEKISQLKLSVLDIKLAGEDTSPILSAKIKNNSIFAIKEVDVIVILYDANRNAVSASRTYLDEIKGEELRDVNFTWPEPFSEKIVVKEIIPQYNIFPVKLK